MAQLQRSLQARRSQLPDEETLPGTRAPSVTPDVRVPTIDYGPIAAGARALDRGSEELSKGLFAKAAALDQVDDYEAKKQLVDFNLQTDMALENAKRDMPPGGEGFTDAWKSDYEDRARATFGKDGTYKVPDHMAQKVDLALVEHSARLQERAQRYELGERDRYHTEDVSRTLIDLQNASAAAPDSYKDNIASGHSLIDAARLTPQIKDRLKKSFASDSEEYAVRGRIERGDIDSVIDDLKKRPVGQQATSASDEGVDFSGKGGPASIRFNNPGAMYPGPSAEKFGATGTQIIGGGHKIAVFPDAISGAAAQFDLLNSRYANKTLGAAISEWSGGNSVNRYLDVIGRDTGLTPDTQLTPEMLKDPTIAIPLAKAMATQEAGKAYPLSDDQWNRAFARGNGMVEKSDLSPVKDGDSVESADAPYQYLKPGQRLKLLNVARVAMRADTDQRLKDDIERIKRTGEPAYDDQGRTSLDRAGKVMTENQLSKARIQWNEAVMEHQALAPLRNMSEDEYLAHAAKIAPDPKDSEDSYKSRARVADKAQKAWNKIVDERHKDPAQAVNTLPEVEDAFAAYKDRVDTGVVTGPDGQPMPGQITGGKTVTPQQMWHGVIDARMAAQARLGIPEYDRKPITKREASALLGMPADVAGMDEREYITRLRSASQKADEVFGPDLAPQVFQSAIALQIKGKDNRETAAGLVAKMVRGEAINRSDLDRMNALTNISRAGGAFDAVDPEDRPDAATGFRYSPSLSLQAAQAQKKVPTPQQLDWVSKDPEKRQPLFDQEFGNGAWATYQTKK